MSHFSMIKEDNHEAVVYCSDKETGLRGYISIHNTVLGPGMGGIRIKSYPSEEAALRDALDLSRAMTYKNSMAGLNYGGAKSVIIADPHTEKTPEMLRAFAHRMNLLRGTYVSASDVGSTADDLNIMREICQWVPCKPKEMGGLGDSSPLTSLGVFEGMKAAVKFATGSDDMAGKRVGVEGVGKVGKGLAKYLIEAGATVTVSDVYPPAVDAFIADNPQIKAVAVDVLPTLDLDVFSPNGIGGTITEAVARGLTAKVVCGGANNPLASHAVADILSERNIAFAPDFVVNAGGVITIAAEMEGFDWDYATVKTLAIYQTTTNVLEHAKANNMLSLDAAIALAQQRIDAKLAEAQPTACSV